MSGKTFGDRLDGYVEVKDRIAMFYAAHPDGRLVTTEVRATSDPDGVPRVWVEAAAFRSPDDPHPGRGWSWMVLPGSTPYTKGSELENTETSAWGRAIGSLGIGIDKGIASAQEVRAKGGSQQETSGDGSLSGTVEATNKPGSNFALKAPAADGRRTLGFKLRQGRQGFSVEARGVLAEQLDQFRDRIIGETATVWGSIDSRSFEKHEGDATQTITYEVLVADRVKVADLELPIDTEPDQEVPDGSVITEAESEAIWDSLQAVAGA